MEVKCNNCGVVFNKKSHQVKITNNNYCTRQCKAKFMVKINNGLFFEKCNKGSSDESCWIWKYSKNKQGYGVAKYNGKNMLAHRVSYMLCYGSIENLRIYQSCGNKDCINPSHLMAL